MMNVILFIGDHQEYQNTLNPKKHINWSELFKLRNQIETEDDWLHSICLQCKDFLESNPSINSIVIPLKLHKKDTSYLGLELALHLRLTRFSSSSVVKNFDSMPIFLLSQDTREEIIGALSYPERNKVFSLFDNEIFFLHNEQVSSLQQRIRLNTKKFSNINIKEFAKKLPLAFKTDNSNHSIANEWGAYTLATVAGIDLEAKSSYQKPNHLQFKYLVANNNISLTKAPSLDLITATGKNVLIIDDEYDKGWYDAFSIIFNNADNISFVEHRENDAIFLEKAKEEITTRDWDLILLDLRLISQDHSDSKQPYSYYSGATILEEIKSNNKGTQVIIVTASNKAWNMGGLLINGVGNENYIADGYYVKESPVFSFNQEESYQNYTLFKERVLLCFEKNFLRSLHLKTKKFIEYLHANVLGQTSTNFVDNCVFALNTAYNILAKDQPKFHSAFILYFNLIEDYLNISFDSSNNSLWKTVKSSRTVWVKPHPTMPEKSLSYLKKYRTTDSFISLEGNNVNYEYYEEEHHTLSPNQKKADLLLKFSAILIYECPHIGVELPSSNVTTTKQEYMKKFYFLKKNFRDNLSHSNENINGQVTIDHCNKIMNIAYMIFSGGHTL